VHSHNKVCTFFAKNKVRFARAEQLWSNAMFFNRGSEERSANVIQGFCQIESRNRN